MENLDMIFSAALKQMIKVEKRCTQTELAGHIGKSQSFVSALMNQDRIGKESDRRAIAEYFDFGYQEFLDFGKELIQKPPGQTDISTDLSDPSIKNITQSPPG